METLLDVIKKFNLYKNSHLDGTDKAYIHDFISVFYQKEFEKIKNKEIKILEIGTCTGASLKLWKEYFKNSKVEGVDIQDRVMPEYRDSNIKYHIGDAYNYDFINKISKEKYDIIIDDGPHTIETQLFFVNNYHKMLNNKGYLIIEDVDSDDNIKALKEKIQEIFKSEPFVYDKRKEMNMNNEVLISIKK